MPRATYPDGEPDIALRCFRLKRTARVAVPIRFCSRCGLPCRLRCRSRGALLPHLFTLTRLRSLRCYGAASRGLSRRSPEGRRRSGSFSVALSLRSFPLALRQNPAGCYPAPYVDGARTFLPRSLSALAGAAVRPTDASGMGAERGQVKVLFSSLRGALATKQSSPSACAALDCFAEPVIGPAKPDPLARNDGCNEKRPGAGRGVCWIPVSRQRGAPRNDEG